MASVTARTRLRWAAILAVCCAIVEPHASTLHAQDIPDVGQPSTDFYGAAGSGVRVAWSLDRRGNPPEIPLDVEVVATLTVTNSTNPQKIKRPDLKKLTEFDKRFVITDTATPAPDADAKQVTFSYRLRPRNRNTEKVPELPFHYYNPAAAEGKQFPLATAKAIPIRVTEPTPKPPPPAVPMTEPEHLFQITTGPAATAAPFTPCVWAWTAAALFGPLLATGWFLAWRRLYPDAARLAKQRRSRAARRAAEAIRRAARSTDSSAEIAFAALHYLRERFPLPPGVATPTEIGAALAEIGLPPEHCAAALLFFRDCDAARFSPSGDNTVSLAAAATSLVDSLEVL